MNLRLPNLISTNVSLYDVLFILQVLNHMGLQSLKTEVGQSLEPGRDHRANEKNLLQAAANSWEDFISQCSCDAEFVWKRQLETIFMESYFGTIAKKRVSAKDYMGTVSISS